MGKWDHFTEDEKREFFRVTLYNVEINVKIHGVNYYGKVKDISGSGIRFSINDDINFNECFLNFEIEGEEFEVKAIFIRKDEKEDRLIPYACRFVGLKEKEKSKLSSVLLKIDARKRKR